MISHATIDEHVGTAWNNLLQAVFPKFTFRYSSDPNNPAFSGYGAFAGQIQEWIEESSYCLTIQTPNSAIRPWLIWEAGMARALGKAIFVVVYGIDPGHLKTPLDSEPHYDGNRKSDVRKIVRSISGDSKVIYDEGDFEKAFPKYERVLKANQHLFDHGEVHYQKRIFLELTHEDCRQLQTHDIIPDGAVVRAEWGSLMIFGYDSAVKEVTWGELIAKLGEDDRNRAWPGSALRWTECLGKSLGKALKRQLTADDPEALPLYYWSPQDDGVGIAYRPSIAAQSQRAGKTTFTISFTHLPPELTARPSGCLGTLFHCQDFARMMRWGILKSARFSDLFCGNLSGDQLREKQAEFLDSLLNIRIEFQNRGLQKDQFLEAFPKWRRQELEDMLKVYYALVGQLEPKNKPSSKTVRSLYPELVSINERFLTAFHERIAELFLEECCEKSCESLRTFVGV
jgi:hypothetical protein